MPLDYDLTGIDQTSAYWTQERTDPITEALIWLTMAVEVSDTGMITAELAPEFFARIYAWERKRGAMLCDLASDGETLVDRPITWHDVAGHVGLKTNVFPRLAPTKFVTKLTRVLRDGWWSEKDPRPIGVIRAEITMLVHEGTEIAKLEHAISL